MLILLYTIDMDNKVLLEWYVEAGVDEAIGDEPINRFSGSDNAMPPAQEISETPSTPPQPLKVGGSVLHHSPAAAITASRALAEKATTIADLEDAVRNFDGCAIKRTASKTVFADGNPNAKIMVIGEAPGAEEDKQGVPFCGQSGQLLDKILASIGLSRKENVYISNTVFWRPPGNRQPSAEEMAICLPFVEKHIALMKPDLLILAGGVAAKAVLKSDISVSRLRGKFYDYKNEYLDGSTKAVIVYHPSYLLRSPTQKRLAWHDMLMIKDFLSNK
jgi:uracil-DNA glycosylase family 4